MVPRVKKKKVDWEPEPPVINLMKPASSLGPGLKYL